MYKIAVITPCFNSATFISECIYSVSLSNTFGMYEIEHIIIDDGSTDNTWDILLKSKVPITTHRLTQNKGPSFARNYGIDRCNADFIFCLDSDDVLFQNSLFSLITYAVKKRADWVYGDIIRGDKQLRYLVGKDYFGWDFKTIKDALTAMYRNEHFFQHTCLFSKNAFMKAGRYDETLHMAEDFDLFTRMLLQGYFPYYLPGPLYIHRFHKHNLSHLYTEDPEKHKKTTAKLYKKYSGELKKILY